MKGFSVEDFDSLVSSTVDQTSDDKRIAALTKKQIEKLEFMTAESLAQIFFIVLKGHSCAKHIEVEFKIPKDGMAPPIEQELCGEFMNIMANCGWIVVFSSDWSRFEIRNFREEKRGKIGLPDYNRFSYTRFDRICPGADKKYLTVVDFWVPYVNPPEDIKNIISFLILFSNCIQVRLYGLTIPMDRICRHPGSKPSEGRIPFKTTLELAVILGRPD